MTRIDCRREPDRCLEEPLRPERDLALRRDGRSGLAELVAFGYEGRPDKAWGSARGGTLASSNRQRDDRVARRRLFWRRSCSAPADQQEEKAAGRSRARCAPSPSRSAKSGTPITLTGRVEAKDEVNLAFRISGRLLENTLRQGDRVEAGQVVARLEPQNEQNALRSAEAALAAAQAALTQTTNHFERQDTLLRQGWTTRANHDQARKAHGYGAGPGRRRAGAARSRRTISSSFTQLEADAPGVVTAVGPRAGSVVQAGQTIATLARKEGRDAVFDVPAQMLRAAPARFRDPRHAWRATRASSRTAASARCRRRPIRSRGRSRSGSA